MAQEWTPPISRTEEVLGTHVANAGSPVLGKWAPYSKTIQGILALVIIAFARVKLEYSMPDAEAQLVAEFVLLVASGIAAWWAAEGRKAAQSVIYWFPRTKAERLEARVAITSPGLLPAAA